MSNNFSLSNLINAKIGLANGAVDEIFYSATKMKTDKRLQKVSLIGEVFPNEFLVRSLNTTNSIYLVGQKIHDQYSNILSENSTGDLGISFITGVDFEFSVSNFTNFASSFTNEEGASAKTDLSSGSTKLKPRNLQINLKMTREFLFGLDASTEDLIKRNVVQSFYEKVLNAAVTTGIGLGNQSHLLNNGSVSEVNGTDFNFGTASTIIKTSQLVSANKNKKWLMNPNTFDLLMNRSIESGSSDRVIQIGVESGHFLAGFPVITSNQITDFKLIFGDWSNLIIPIFFDDLSILVDPYSEDGFIRLYFSIFTDFAIQNPSQFVKTSIT